jgi:hypothetical protein
VNRLINRVEEGSDLDSENDQPVIKDEPNANDLVFATEIDTNYKREQPVK